MVSTRRNNQTVVDINRIKRVIKEKTKKNYSKVGRPAGHDLRALLAIHVKLVFPNATLTEAIIAVNDVCNNYGNDWHEAAKEDDLCWKTLKNRCKPLLGAAWKRIRSDKETSSRARWVSIVHSLGERTANSFNELGGEACDRVAIARLPRWDTPAAVAAPVAVVVVVAPVEAPVAQEGLNTGSNWNAATQHDPLVMHSAHHVELEPQQLEEPMSTEFAGVDEVEALCCVDDDAEMHNNTLGSSYIDLDAECALGNGFELDDDELNDFYF